MDRQFTLALTVGGISLIVGSLIAIPIKLSRMGNACW
jgi:hypothetical protein